MSLNLAHLHLCLRVRQPEMKLGNFSRNRADFEHFKCVVISSFKAFFFSNFHKISDLASDLFALVFNIKLK